MFKLTVVTDSGEIDVPHKYADDITARICACEIGERGYFNFNADGSGGGSFWPVHRINLVVVEKEVDTN